MKTAENAPHEQPSGLKRRSLLQAAGAAGGGLLMGVSLLNPRDAKAATVTVTQANAWIKIASDNTITLYCSSSEVGQGVYTSLPALIAEELNVALSQVQVVFAPPNAALYGNPLLGGAQLTGGSTSVRVGWTRLRVAGAQVRMMLISAAAAQWKVSEAFLTAQNGTVVGPKAGQTATYGSLAAAAAKLPVPQNPVLKDPANFKIIGKPMPRLDTPLKVDGSAKFGMDVRLPGLLYAALAQCPVIGGTVQNFDASLARAMPGVVNVVLIPDGVAVVANSWWQANNARDKLSIQWNEGPGAALSDTSMLAGIRAASLSAASVALPVTNVGNADGVIAASRKVVRAEYTMPLLAHGPLEPMNFTANVQAGKVDLYGPTQWQDGAANAVAAAVGVPASAVTLTTTFLGGSFGRRIDIDYAIQAAQISKAAGKPVQLVYSRQDDMQHDFYRPQSVHQLAAAIDANGRPAALTFRLTSQSITERVFNLAANVQDGLMIESAVPPYAIPALKVEVVKYNAGLRVGYMRSVSNALNVFAHETFIDELAVLARQDPVAYRYALLGNNPRAANVLSLAAAQAGWTTKPPKGNFRGVALMNAYDSYLAMVAEISINAANEITVEKVSTAVDVGQIINADTVDAQIQSSVIYGMSAALWGEITVVNGRVQQTNLANYRVAHIAETPVMSSVLVSSTASPGGIGEPATALIGPAIGNALFAATGKRLRKMPFTPANIAAA